MAVDIAANKTDNAALNMASIEQELRSIEQRLQRADLDIDELVRIAESAGAVPRLTERYRVDRGSEFRKQPIWMDRVEDTSDVRE